MQKQIPQRWKDVLGAVQRYFPDAVIAGGALRDLALGVEPKDVDIFVRCQGFSADTILVWLQAAFGYESLGVLYNREDKTPETAANEYADWNPAVSLIVDFAYDGTKVSDPITDADIGFACAGPNFQVTVLDQRKSSMWWGEDVIDNFDLGINMVYFSGDQDEGEGAWSSWHLLDMKHRTLTVLTCRSEDERARIENRITKLKRKLPGEWTAVWPKEDK